MKTFNEQEKAMTGAFPGTIETLNIKLATEVIGCLVRSIDQTHEWVLELGQARTHLIEARMWLEETQEKLREDK